MSSITHVAPVASSSENLSLLLGPRRGVIYISGRRQKGIYTSPAASIGSIGWISLSSLELRESSDPFSWPENGFNISPADSGRRLLS